jgi:hypothetical protein
MTDEAPEVWYRFDDQDYSVADDWSEHSHTQYGVQVIEFHVVKHTPKGVWLIRSNGWGHKRFVLHTAKKRFACATKELAKESYIARKNKQIRIYQYRIQEAEHHIRIAGWK